MESEIRVYVVNYPGRTNLVMRYRDPFTGKQIARTTGTDKQRDAERRKRAGFYAEQSPTIHDRCDWFALVDGERKKRSEEFFGPYSANRYPHLTTRGFKFALRSDGTAGG